MPFVLSVAEPSPRPVQHHPELPPNVGHGRTGRRPGFVLAIRLPDSIGELYTEDNCRQLFVAIKATPRP
jgi:hypothetical protein